MKRILLLGAGRSSGRLIDYLTEHSSIYNWLITIADRDLSNNPRLNGLQTLCELKEVDMSDKTVRVSLIAQSDLVISMLPAFFQNIIAEECISLKKHLISPSYKSIEVEKLHQKAIANDVLVLTEMGLDPGIDHMSAMKIIDEVKSSGGKILSFHSSTGGLMAPESDTNPWNYKFSWNPRNVVIAGNGGGSFLDHGQYKFVPYHRLFRSYHELQIPNMGLFEVYPNRNSIRYKKEYGLENVETIYRGTIRRKGFCDAWNALVQLGMTDDTYIINQGSESDMRSYTNIFLSYGEGVPVEEKLCNILQIKPSCDVMQKLLWLGLFSKNRVDLVDKTPAEVLEEILRKKWTMHPEDKDMVIMYHEIVYELNGEKHSLVSWMSQKGKSKEETAMSDTVGLPVGIVTKLMLNKKIASRGVLIPNKAEIYIPVLKELSSLGIEFKEQIV